MQRPHLRYRMLGPLEVLDDGVPLDLGGPRHRRLLAVLLLHAGDVVPAERVIDELWGEAPPPSAAAMVHVRVSELRKALRAAGHEADLETHGSGYVLRAHDVDAREFERLADAGRRVAANGDQHAARRYWHLALALWRGPALADVTDRSFAHAEIDRLDALRDRTLADRIDADLALGHQDEVVAELTGLVRAHPLRERYRAQLMLALYRAGRQGEALQAFQEARTALIDQLGVEPGADLQRLHTAILRQDPVLERAEPRLPVALTSFVGREQDLAQVRDGLAASRLVTIVGVGGVGKSRLAIEVARGRDSPCWLVELASLTQPGLLVHAVAAALGVREDPRRPLMDLLVDRFDTAALLVLDNCEHLIQGVAELTDTLLRACPRLRILATSRERLRVTGEVLCPLSGLPVPPAGSSDPAVVARAPAAQLLVERAAAVAPQFRLSDATARAVGQICQRLDGLPLAIELAAARLNAIAVEEIAKRIDDRFGLLSQGSRTAPARHQAMRSVIDWSYDLLSDEQRQLFETLCVFSGGFTLDAIEAIEAIEADADAVARLVDKSLVVAETATPGNRYRILETLCAYGLERLAERGAAEPARENHAAYYLALAERAGAALRGAGQPGWLARLQTEHGNITAALDWSIARGDAATAARLAGSLYQFWDLSGRYTEGRHWLTLVLAMPGPVPAAARVRALLAYGGLAAIQGDLAEAAAVGEEAAERCERAGDPTALAHALLFLGFVAIYAEEQERATRLLRRALDSARTAEHRWLTGRALLFLAIAALAGDDHRLAAQLADECAETLRPLGDLDSLAGARMIRAVAAWRAGDPTRAAADLRDGLLEYQGLGALWPVSLGLSAAAYLAGARGEHRRAARMLGAAEAVRASLGAAVLPFTKPWHDATITAATEALGAEAFHQAWCDGAALTPDAAIAAAVSEGDG